MDVLVTRAGATHRLRQEILRPHQTLAEMNWPGDDHPSAIHLVAIDDEPIGMVSFFPLERDGSPAERPYRLRGMGVVAHRRSEGVGAILLRRGVELVAEAGGDEVWCHARQHAVAFYERHGFVTSGDYWDVAVIGPHVVMVRPVGNQPPFAAPPPGTDN